MPPPRSGHGRRGPRPTGRPAWNVARHRRPPPTPPQRDIGPPWWRGRGNRSPPASAAASRPTCRRRLRSRGRSAARTTPATPAPSRRTTAVADQLVDQHRQRLAAGVVLHEERHPAAPRRPQAVAVWAYPGLVGAHQSRILRPGERRRPLACGLRPPLPNRAAGWVRAWPARSVKNWLTPSRCARVRLDGPAAPLDAGVVAPRRTLVTAGGDDLGAELVDDVVVRVRAAVGRAAAGTGRPAAARYSVRNRRWQKSRDGNRACAIWNDVSTPWS